MSALYLGRRVMRVRTVTSLHLRIYMGPRDLSVVERCPYYGGVLAILGSTDLYIYSSFD